MIVRTLTVFAAAAATTLAASTGSISGTVTDAGGQPLAGIAVYGVASGRQTAPGLPPASVHAVTDSNGGFVFQNLPAEAYNLCAVAAVAGQISSCESGTRPFMVSVAAGSNQTGVTLVMGSGDVVTVSVTDSGGNLQGGKRLSIGFIADNGMYGFAKRASQTASVFGYQMTIPKGHTSWLVVDTPLAVLDAQGSAITAGQRGQALSGPTSVTLTLP